MTACLGLMFLAHVHPHHLPEFSVGSALRTHLLEHVGQCFLSSFRRLGVLLSHAQHCEGAEEGSL